MNAETHRNRSGWELENEGSHASAPVPSVVVYFVVLEIKTAEITEDTEEIRSSQIDQWRRSVSRKMVAKFRPPKVKPCSMRPLTATLTPAPGTPYCPARTHMVPV
jgi:hypothetical protein